MDSVYPPTMADHGPCRTLAGYRRQLIARRLELLRLQVITPARAALLAPELDDITAKLRAIDEAVGK